MFQINIKDYFSYIDNYKSNYTSKELTALMNADSLYNLPHINIKTDNQELLLHNQCRDGAIYMGTNATDKDCFDRCGSTGQLIHVLEGQEIFINDKLLSPGYWCSLIHPKCNLKTGYVLATTNNVVCRSKYPNMFGGEAADHITACSNEEFPAIGAVLFDYKEMEPVQTQLINMNHEDERLSDGEYRFRCNYPSGFIEHPLNRFHPLKNPCTYTLYRPHPKVQVKYTNGSWECDCGPLDETRVQHIDSNDKQSTCSSCAYKNDDESTEIPIRCFSVNSSYRALSKYLPCIGTNFINLGGDCDVIKINKYQPQKIPKDQTTCHKRDITDSDNHPRVYNFDRYNEAPWENFTGDVSCSSRCTYLNIDPPFLIADDKYKQFDC